MFEDLTEESELNVALRIQRALLMNNTTRFFTLIEKKATLLQSCLLLRYFNIVRLKRLNELISSSRANDEVRLTDLTNLFALDSDDETRDYLEQFGYTVSATAPPCFLVPSAVNRDPPNIAVKLSQKLIKSKYKGNLKDVSDDQTTVQHRISLFCEDHQPRRQCARRSSRYARGK